MIVRVSITLLWSNNLKSKHSYDVAKLYMHLTCVKFGWPLFHIHSEGCPIQDVTVTRNHILEVTCLYKERRRFYWISQKKTALNYWIHTFFKSHIWSKMECDKNTQHLGTHYWRNVNISKESESIKIENKMKICARRYLLASVIKFLSKSQSEKPFNLRGHEREKLWWRKEFILEVKQFIS